MRTRLFRPGSGFRSSDLPPQNLLGFRFVSPLWGSLGRNFGILDPVICISFCKHLMGVCLGRDSLFEPIRQRPPILLFPRIRQTPMFLLVCPLSRRGERTNNNPFLSVPPAWFVGFTTKVHTSSYATARNQSNNWKTSDTSHLSPVTLPQKNT